MVGGMSKSEYLMHNYVRRIKELAARGELEKPGHVGQVMIAHDTWCNVFSGGRCDCSPDIRIEWHKPGVA